MSITPKKVTQLILKQNNSIGHRSLFGYVTEYLTTVKINKVLLAYDLAIAIEDPLISLGYRR